MLTVKPIGAAGGVSSREVMAEPVRSSYTVNVAGAVGTLYHGLPRLYFTLVASSFVPFAEDAIPATCVLGERLNSRTFDEWLVWT